MSGEIGPVRDRIASATRPVVVFASPSAVEGFAREVGVRSLERVRPVAIGPTTARRIRELSDVDVTTARSSDVQGLVSAVVAAGRRTEEDVFVDAR